MVQTQGYRKKFLQVLVVVGKAIGPYRQQLRPTRGRWSCAMHRRAADTPLANEISANLLVGERHAQANMSG